MCIAAVSVSNAQNVIPFSAPKHEVRAVWLTTIGGLDWPKSYAQSSTSAERQRQQLRDILDRLQHGGVNTVLIQTRVRATTIYPSSIEPWDGCMSGKPGVSPGYDPLAFAVDECHKRGMEVQAWVVTMPVGKWNSYGCRTLRRTYPSLVRKIGDDGYMKPELNATADYIARICGEITRNYDIDGIHLDYIRYPEVGKRYVGSVEGRRYITRIVERISSTVKGIKPWVKLSCSPVGKHADLARYSSNGWNARTAMWQDAQAWLCDGLMDELLPMMYFKGNNFYPFALDWQENNHGKIVAPGLGIYFLSPKERNWDLCDIKREMYFLRCHGMGHAYFRSQFFTDNVKGIYDFAADMIDHYPALIPPMTWASNARPQAPSAINLTRDDDADRLEWSGACDMSTGDYLTYNIYRSSVYPVDVNDARNLVAVRRRAADIVIPRSTLNADMYHYAVTAMDRFGNESLPVMTNAPMAKTAPPMICRKLLANDGRTLIMPPAAKSVDAEYAIIESLTGVMTASMPYDCNKINISRIPDGMYYIKTVNRKGITYKLGCFMIRRRNI